MKDRGKLVFKLKLRDALLINISLIVVFICGWGVIVVATQYYLTNGREYILRGGEHIFWAIVFYLCGIFPISIPLFWVFRRKYLECYENGLVPSIFSLSPIFMGILSYKDKFIPFSSIKRVEIGKIVDLDDKKLEILKKANIDQRVLDIVVIYTNSGWVEESIGELENAEKNLDTVSKVINSIKNYSEKYGIKIEWSNKITPIFQRKKLYKKLSENKGVTHE